MSMNYEDLLNAAPGDDQSPPDELFLPPDTAPQAGPPDLGADPTAGLPPTDIPAAPVASPEPLPLQPPSAQGFGGAVPPDAFGAYAQGFGPGQQTFGEGLPDNERFGAGPDFRVAPDMVPYMDTVFQQGGGGMLGNLLRSGLSGIQNAAGRQDVAGRMSPENRALFSGEGNRGATLNYDAWKQNVADQNLTRVSPVVGPGDTRAREYAYESGRRAYENLPYEPPKAPAPPPRPVAPPSDVVTPLAQSAPLAPRYQSDLTAPGGEFRPANQIDYGPLGYDEQGNQYFQRRDGSVFRLNTVTGTVQAPKEGVALPKLTTQPPAKKR